MSAAPDRAPGSAAMPVLTRERVRELDRIATEQYGIPGIVLLENAGRSAAGACADWMARQGVSLEGARVAVLCGPGNNGGDGYVLARHLHNAGARVEVFSTLEREAVRGDAFWARSVLERMGWSIPTWTEADGESGRLEGAGIVVDALLGTGSRGAPRGAIAAAIRAANTAPGRRIALDLPSGLDCDTGEAAEPCFRAELTITFAAAKPGFARPGARAFTGEIVAGDIGVPRELVARMAGAPALP